METKICYVCKIEKEKSKFGRYKHNDGYQYSGRCNACMHKSKRSKPHHKLYLNLKRRMRTDFKKRGYVKTRNFDLIFGIRSVQFKLYIETLFVDGMSWGNYGEWEIDHIYPLGKTENQEDYEKYFYYTNLQPLFKKDNRDKGSKLDYIKK